MSGAADQVRIDEPPPLRLQRDPQSSAARASSAYEIHRPMQVDIEVEGELYRVFVLVTGAKQLFKSPEPNGIDLRRPEGLTLNRSHPFSWLRSALTITLIPSSLEVNPSSE